MTGNLDGALADIDRAMLIAWVPSSYQPQRESVLEKIEQRDHPQAYALMLSGQKKHGNKDYAGAIADYTAAIKLSPKFPDYYWRRAISESWGESTGYIERWRDDCSKAYLIDSRARYWIAKAQGDMAYATTFQTISLNLASIYHSAAFAYKQASELDASQGDDLLAKSNDAENRSRDTENRVRYPSSYSAQGNKAAAPTTTTVNLLRDKSRSRFLHDFVVIFSCPSTKDKRRYEVTADDQGQATNLAREHMNQGQWCGYNASFESATQVN
jgi:tetratricopeptide (TPR) repeat protein